MTCTLRMTRSPSAKYFFVMHVLLYRAILLLYSSLYLSALSLFSSALSCYNIGLLCFPPRHSCLPTPLAISTLWVLWRLSHKLVWMTGNPILFLLWCSMPTLLQVLGPPIFLGCFPLFSSNFLLSFGLSPQFACLPMSGILARSLVWYHFLHRIHAPLWLVNYVLLSVMICSGTPNWRIMFLNTNCLMLNFFTDTSNCFHFEPLGKIVKCCQKVFSPPWSE